jgi:hypothetical protein
LSAGASSQFAAVLVVADAAAVAKHDVGAIADYVAMIGLSEVDLSQPCGAIESILDQFSSGCVRPAAPDAVTTADTTFLKALYATDPTQFAWLQQSSIADAMLRDEKEH